MWPLGQKLTYFSVLLVFITDLDELDVGLLELLEDLVLGDEGPVLVHDLLHLLLWPVLDGPVLQLGLGQGQEGHNAALLYIDTMRLHHMQTNC